MGEREDLNLTNELDPVNPSARTTDRGNEQELDAVNNLDTTSDEEIRPAREDELPEEEIVAEKVGNGYVLRGVHGQVGEISYRLVDVDTWVIDHTTVEASYRGKGLARQLLDFVVEDAREKGRKIIPSCPYAQEQFKKHEEYSDVWLNSDANQYSDPYSTNSVNSSR